jgi:hypothetical protein
VENAAINIIAILFIGDKMVQNNIPNPSGQKNPLAGWFRQPKIYVKLPSGGKFYPPNSLDVSETGEYAVYSMTAKDELMFKTPDALLSGQSTVELIKSCIPSILDPWKMPSIDLDFALIAIRIATYGDKMEISSNCPSCNEENSHDVDLNRWLEIFGNFVFADVIDVEPLTVYIKPYSYHEMTKTSIKTMEQQKIFEIINNENISEEEKLDKFGKSFVKLTELTVDIIADTIVRIDTPEDSVTDKKMIKEFINNCPKDIFDKISSHVTSIREEIGFTEKNAVCGHCEHKYNIPITMDQSNFFAVRS